MAVWISDDENKIAINKGLNLSNNTIQITIQSYEINSTDNLLALNQIQLIGTHNSYHIEPHSSVMQLIRKVMPSQADAIKYSHRPLTEQLELIGMRKFELDIFHDNKGGGYSQPLGAIMAHGINWKGNYPEFDEDALKDPGMKVLHFPNFDFRSNTPNLIKALNEIEAWSIKNSYHLPIMILIETKNTGNGSSGFGIKDFVELEKEIKSVLNLSRIITPDEVRGKFSTLNKAIRTKGWPSLYKSRGRFIFALDNQGKELDSYLKLHPQLKGAILFVSSPPGRPESAFLKINDPIRNHSLIKEKITEGYLIRTRA
ncbi:MAG: Ca2+-dependent phosphoinositide-specific phospholipase C, partial [Verrucomicrobiota bacterium]|nr:Ca2+-dependent phosphoinositide-specific phospholipase C [Verrucomicrobiota bacterium]